MLIIIKVMQLSNRKWKVEICEIKIRCKSLFFSNSSAPRSRLQSKHVRPDLASFSFLWKLLPLSKQMLSLQLSKRKQESNNQKWKQGMLERSSFMVSDH